MSSQGQPFDNDGKVELDFALGCYRVYRGRHSMCILGGSGLKPQNNPLLLRKHKIK